MLKQAHEAGIRDAKLAYVPPSLLRRGAGAAGDFAKWLAIGNAPQAFVEGSRAFQPGGMLHWRNVLWPTMPGQPGRQLMGRAGTLMTAAMLPTLARQDRAQGEGMLSSALGGVGSLAGMMYGGTAGGLLGTPIGTALGHRAGVGLGHLLGSKPESVQP